MEKKMIKKLIILAICNIVTTIYATEQPTNYTVDKTFQCKDIKMVVAMEPMSGNKVACLTRKQHIIIFDEKTGKTLKTFKINTGGWSKALATDKDDNLYIFKSKFKNIMVKRGRRKYKKSVAISCTCVVFDKDFKKIREFDIQDAKNPKTAKMINGTLAVADMGTKKVYFVDTKTGKTIASSKPVRICCGIFDISKGNDNTIIISNLGAFKVQQYNQKGKLLKSFGKRGKNLANFYGCCNPVSAIQLANGCLITAEKSPTRIKIYDSDWKNPILVKGITELVKGCYHIPMLKNAQEAIYLASDAKGIIKCIPVK